MRLMWCLVLIFTLNETYSARILVYIPTPSISHQVPFRPLTQELARRGHEVVIITTDPAFPQGKTPANLTEIDVHDVSYADFKDKFLHMKKGDKKYFMSQVYTLTKLFNENFKKQLNAPQVREVIFGNQTFDLLILEACTTQTLALSHIFKAPVIQASSLGALVGNKNVIGAPSHPLLYPTAIRLKINNLTFWDKLRVLFYHFFIELMLRLGESRENEMLRSIFGKDLPTISELKDNVDMLFVNIHPIFEGNHPVPPGVVYMWGIHKKPEQELPVELKSYLDSSEHGVIYLSFGTNTNTTNLPPGIVEKFINVFCELPYDVLWKWDADEIPGSCSNIRIGKWFPQSDLLRHPKIKLFVTQGGMQSTDEAFIAGVPLIGIPMLADQWYNVEKYVEFKIGIYLDATTFTQEDFKNAVTTIIKDESYHQNVKKLNELMRDDPLPPLERAVWWTEYVIRHKGAKHLRAPAANISWAQYLELEFVAILLSGLFVIMSLSLLILYKVVRIISERYFKSNKFKTN